MKLTFAIFSVFLLISIIKANPTNQNEDLNEDALDSISLEKGANITPEQKKCIEDAIKKIREENPQLADWFAEVDKSKAKIEAKIKKCKELPSEVNQKKCLKAVKIIAKRELGRLIRLLPSDQKPILGKIKAAAEKCLSN